MPPLIPSYTHERTDFLIDTAIILAAGFGSRLSARGVSKPLVQVRGVSLIEISVRQALAAGVTRIVVVTSHEAALVEAELVSISARLGCEIIARRLDDWSKPNGWSVIEGARGLSEPFLLMMADHIFGDGLLARLSQQSLEAEDAILAVDRADNPLVDPDDATWVALGQGGRIRRIGKEIADYDVVDCGAFLANAKLPLAIQSAIDAGKSGTLSDGMQVLADMDRASIVDVEGAWWIDVDDPRAHDLATEQVPAHLGLFADGPRVPAGATRAA